MLRNVNSVTTQQNNGLVGTASSQQSSSQQPRSNQTTNAALQSLQTAPKSSEKKLDTKEITSAPKTTPFTLEQVRDKLNPYRLEHGEDGDPDKQPSWDRNRAMFEGPSNTLHNAVMQQLIDDHGFVVNIGAGGSISYDKKVLDNVIMTQPNKKEGMNLKSFLEKGSQTAHDVYTLDAKTLATVLSTVKNKTLPCLAAVNVFDCFSTIAEIRETLASLAKLQVKGNKLIVISDTNPFMVMTMKRIKDELIKRDGVMNYFLYPISEQNKLIILTLLKKSIRNFDKKRGSNVYENLTKINHDDTLMSQALEEAERARILGQLEPLYKIIKEFLASNPASAVGINLRDHYNIEMGNCLTELGYSVELDRKIEWERVDREKYIQVVTPLLGATVDSNAFDIAISAVGIGSTHNINTFKLGTPHMEVFEKNLGLEIFPDKMKTGQRDDKYDVGFAATVIKAVKN